MNLYPQNLHGWLRYLCVTVHGCGIGLLWLCALLAPIVNLPMPLLHPYSQALKIVLAVQCVVTVALFSFDRRLALCSLGIIVIMFLLLPFATRIKQYKQYEYFSERKSFPPDVPIDTHPVAFAPRHSDTLDGEKALHLKLNARAPLQ